MAASRLVILHTRELVTDYPSLFRLDGRTALVAGAASGIGAASAEALAAFGARVVCADLRSEGARETAERIRHEGGTADALGLDIRDAEGVRAAVAKAEPDVLVSTPSINVRKPILDYSAEEFDRVIGLNLGGTFTLLREAGRGMAKRGRGSIIAFASIRAQVVEPGQGVYAATKAGIVQLCRALASELGPQGVRVNAIAPGVVETPLTAPIKSRPDWYRAYADKTILRRWGQPHEIATAVVYLASDASSYVTGSLLFVDGGWTAADGRFDPPL